ncbi:MAG TPA: 6-phosphofructokinase [Dehalococcoidia bacterium]|nr:6-phosphofructokinase [Dehalococcoidia bacterium]
MRLGILTGGGDVPGLNAAIKAAVLRAADEGHEVLGIRRGWAGLLEYNPDDALSWDECVIALDPGVVRVIDRSGGTFLHTSRTNPANVRSERLPAFLRDAGLPCVDGVVDATRHAVRVVEHLGLEALLPIGGDDTLSFAERINREGVPVVALPKTMDNDVHGTDYCVGFSTAVTRSVQYIHQLRSSAGSHERLAVVELFGRNSGETSLLAAYLAGVDRAIISEVPFEAERLAGLLQQDKAGNPSHYAMVTVSEGAQMQGVGVLESGEPDAYGHRKLGGIGQATADALKRLTGEDVMYQPLSYLMRSGAPDSLDLMVAVNYATMAVTLAGRGAQGRMVALRDGTYTSVPLRIVRQGIKRVDVEELYDAQAYRPKVRHMDGKPMFLY